MNDGAIRREISEVSGGDIVDISTVKVATETLLGMSFDIYLCTATNSYGDEFSYCIMDDKVIGTTPYNMGDSGYHPRFKSIDQAFTYHLGLCIRIREGHSHVHANIPIDSTIVEDMENMRPNVGTVSPDPSK